MSKEKPWNYKEPIKTRCGFCGEIVKIKEYNFKKDGRHFCKNSNCKNEWMARTFSEENHWNYRKVKVNCYICGKEKIVSLSQFKHSRYKKFICGEGHWKEEKCAFCGRLIKVGSKSRNLKNHYCDRFCNSLSQMKGSGNSKNSFRKLMRKYGYVDIEKFKNFARDIIRQGHEGIKQEIKEARL
jgi:hypothetical protein